jgi:phosphotransferase system enzyme I (PtsI)
MLEFQGLCASEGIAIGKAVVISFRVGEVARIPIPELEIDAELVRFRKACQEVKRRIEETRRSLGRLFTEELASIFDAHLRMLEDPAFVDVVERRIRSEKVNAEWAIHDVALDLGQRFASLDNPYLRERGVDLEDVVRQLLESLRGFDAHEIVELPGEVILVAEDLMPSDAIRYGRANVIGFVVERGGTTSHTAIIARSLGIPALTGVSGICAAASNDDWLIVDADAGKVILYPTPEVLESYRKRKAEKGASLAVAAPVDLPVMTRDGVEIELQANIDLPEELPSLAATGIRSIGLYRSEFLYMESDPRVPSEEDHYRIYRKLLEAAAPHPAILRTYDLGGRKLAREIMDSSEENPVLGMRGIRLTLARPAQFRIQLRGMLRAGVHGNLWILAPMVTRVDEVLQLKRHLSEAAAELDREGIPRADRYRVGAMVEVPAAALIADQLAQVTDFLALGTNDLVQYTLAADRNNPAIVHLYDPMHPAVLRLIRLVVAACGSVGTPLSVCGEMAAQEPYLEILVGLGIRRFSAHPRILPRLAQFLRGLDSREAGRRALDAARLEPTQISSPGVPSGWVIEPERQAERKSMI